MKKKIWVNTIVNNEENFVWFAIMSVVDFVDKVLVWDSGSTDKTVEIIKDIKKVKGNKIEFREVGSVDKYKFTNMRQKMLDESKCDWILVLDGDEIWWEDSIKKLRDIIDREGDQIDGIVVPMILPVGDIYHIQEESAGRYEILGRKGHYSLRAISKKITGLHVDWPYGKESFLDEDNCLIQEREKIVFINAPYLHVTHLRRSQSKREFDKFKYELGSLVDKNFQYPEVFYRHYSQIISSPWSKIYGIALLKAKILTLLRQIKRKLQ